MGKSSANQRQAKRPTAMPTGTPTTSPAIASRVACQAMAPRVWPAGEPDRAQHREIVASSTHGRHQRMCDGGACQQREERTERQWEVLDAGEVSNCGREHCHLREQVGSAELRDPIAGRARIDAGRAT